MNRKMKFSMFAWLVAAVLLHSSAQLRQAEASKMKLRPLNAREVYRILRDVGREDAVPEGRIVSQGIAAFAGFTLGLTKGIGGSILFDIITANVTGLLGTGASTATSSNSSSTAQEICFNSRNARSLAHAEAVARHYEESDERVGRSTRRLRYEYVDDIADFNDIADYGIENNGDDDDDADEYEDAEILGRQTTSGTPTAGTGTVPTGTTPSPTAGTATTGTLPSPTATTTNGVTTSNGKPAITCIVIQK